MSKKSGFHRQIWPKSVTHLHGITQFYEDPLMAEPAHFKEQSLTN